MEPPSEKITSNDVKFTPELDAFTRRRCDAPVTEATDGDRTLGPEGRQARITELVLSRGAVSAQELAETFGVSAMTIHRDLDELQRQGVLRKSRGGATAQPSGTFESNVVFRAKANVEAKRQIAKHAAGLVEPGMSVLLDDSTTAAALLPFLATIGPITVATNYLATLTELAALREVEVVGLGGHFDPQHNSFLGTPCIEMLRSMRFDIAFVSTSAVTGAYAFHQEDKIVAVKREMVAAAEHTHLLIDHSKLHRTALHRLLPLHRFASVVVDPGTPGPEVATLRENDVRVDVA